MIAKRWRLNYWRVICSCVFLGVFIYMNGIANPYASVVERCCLGALCVITPLLVLTGHFIIAIVAFIGFWATFEPPAHDYAVWVFSSGTLMAVAVFCFYLRCIWAVKGRLLPALVFGVGLGWVLSPWPVTESLCSDGALALIYAVVAVGLIGWSFLAKPKLPGWGKTILAYTLLFMAVVGKAYLCGYIIDGDLDSVRNNIVEKWTREVKAARLSTYNKACKYRDGDGVPKDVQKAKELFFECVRDGGEDVYAAKLAIVQIVMEFGPNEEEGDAKKILDRLAEKDQYEPAQEFLAKMIVAKVKGEKSVKDSLDELDRAARYGSVEAMLMLGRFYAKGEGFFDSKKDIDKARKYLSQAVENGSVEASKILRELD